MSKNSSEIGDEAIHCLNTYAGVGLFEVECKKKQFVLDLRKKLVATDDGSSQESHVPMHSLRYCMIVENPRTM